MALTIRLTPDQEKLVEQLKEQLNETSASKALLKAADIVVKEVPILKEQLIECDHQNEGLHADNFKLKSKISVFKNAFEELTAIT